MFEKTPVRVTLKTLFELGGTSVPPSIHTKVVAKPQNTSSVVKNDIPPVIKMDTIEIIQRKVSSNIKRFPGDDILWIGDS